MILLLAEAPALPLGEAGKYVAGAYIVFLILIVVYVAIMAAKLQRIERDLRELAGFAEQRQGRRAEDEPREGGRPDDPSCLALGVSHKTAPLDLRERLSLTEGRAVGALRELTAADRHPRGGGDLDLQSHRALPGRLRPGRGRVDGARRPHPTGGDPPDRAARPPLLAALRRSRSPPLPRHRRARLDDRRRGRDPGPGQTRLRAGPGRGRHRTDPQPPLPRRPRRRRPRPRWDRDQREGRLDPIRCGRSGPPHPGRSQRPASPRRRRRRAAELLARALVGRGIPTVFVANPTTTARSGLPSASGQTRSASRAAEQLPAG